METWSRYNTVLRENFGQKSQGNRIGTWSAPGTAIQNGAESTIPLSEWNYHSQLHRRQAFLWNNGGLRVYYSYGSAEFSFVADSKYWGFNTRMWWVDL